MAPPPRARPGFSRRAQYTLFAGYVAAVVGVLAGLVLAVTARFDPEGHAAIQSVFSDATAPIAIAGRNVAGGLANAYEGAAAYVDAGSKNRTLEAELRGTRARLIEARAIESENHRLRRLTRLIEGSRDPILAARLIASTGANVHRYATLSAGQRDGVTSGQPVRTSEGLVGRVVVAGRITARVLLIIDSGNVVPVKRLSDGLPALATGRGDGALDVRALQSGGNPFRINDLLVTSGAGGIYPPGIPVAVVRLLTNDSGVARPLADPARLDFALVEQPFQPQGDLPPPPEAP
ncbi:Cell shape-determining protein MreC [Sphingomonas antarctica]|uniref:rod shape-determining protein MreC n=1 Tax=Sphingomonas antarctica TaxID=2040274 RepID=UPI0039E957A5